MYRAAWRRWGICWETPMQVKGVDHIENARILANRAVMTLVIGGMAQRPV